MWTYYLWTAPESPSLARAIDPESMAPLALAGSNPASGAALGTVSIIDIHTSER